MLCISGVRKMPSAATRALTAARPSLRPGRKFGKVDAHACSVRAVGVSLSVVVRIVFGAVWDEGVILVKNYRKFPIVIIIMLSR